MSEPLRRAPTPAEAEALRERAVAATPPPLAIEADAHHTGCLLAGLGTVAGIVLVLVGWARAWVVPTAAVAGWMLGAVLTAIEASLDQYQWRRRRAMIARRRWRFEPVDIWDLELAEVARTPSSLIVTLSDGDTVRLAGPARAALLAAPGFPCARVTLLWSAELSLAVVMATAGPAPPDRAAGDEEVVLAELPPVYRVPSTADAG